MKSPIDAIRSVDNNEVAELFWLANELPNILPRRMKPAEGLCPAMVYVDASDCEISFGDPKDLLRPDTHRHIQTVGLLSPDYNRRISGVVVLTDNQINLALEGLAVKDLGGLEVVRQSSSAEQFGEIFIGGFFDESKSGLAESVCTVGLIRVVSNYLRLAKLYELDRDETLDAIAIAIQQLKEGKIFFNDPEIIKQVQASERVVSDWEFFDD